MSLRASESVLRISNVVLRQIMEHAWEDHPLEACGIVTSGDRVIRIRNASTRPETAYNFDPVAQLAAWQEMHDRGETLKIIYHSHTGRDAGASGMDRSLAVFPVFYLIVSTHDDTIRGYVLGDALTEVEVVPSISPG